MVGLHHRQSTKNVYGALQPFCTASATRFLLLFCFCFWVSFSFSFCFCFCNPNIGKHLFCENISFLEKIQMSMEECLLQNCMSAYCDGILPTMWLEIKHVWLASIGRNGLYYYNNELGVSGILVNFLLAFKRQLTNSKKTL